MIGRIAISRFLAFEEGWGHLKTLLHLVWTPMLASGTKQIWFGGSLADVVGEHLPVF